MAGYDNEKDKLSKIWEKLQKNEFDISFLSGLNINYSSINYVKPQSIYLVEENFNLSLSPYYYGLIKFRTTEDIDASKLKLIVSLFPFSKADYGLEPSVYRTSLFVQQKGDFYYAFIYIACLYFPGQSYLLSNFYLQFNKRQDYYAIPTAKK